MEPRYWVIVASNDHVQAAVAGGFAQACHGKASPLKRMRSGDFIVYYSGKQTMGKADPCQQFTAIGKLTGDEHYELQVTEDFCPSRRDIAFLPCKAVSIVPLIGELDFIRDKKSWGYPFRFGFFEIREHDFDLISSQMLEKEYVGKH